MADVKESINNQTFWSTDFSFFPNYIKEHKAVVTNSPSRLGVNYIVK